MKSVLDPKEAQALRDRIAKLRPDGRPAWGRMSASQMLCHLSDSFVVALGEKPIIYQGGFLTSPWIRKLLVHMLPFPKGVPTTPEFLETQPGVWDDDVRRWNEGLDRFLRNARLEKAKWGLHPMFGPMPTEEWGQLTHKHHDHHLRQFKV